MAPFAGTARRVLCTNGACPLFPESASLFQGTRGKRKGGDGRWKGISPRIAAPRPLLPPSALRLEHRHDSHLPDRRLDRTRLGNDLPRARIAAGRMPGLPVGHLLLRLRLRPLGPGGHAALDRSRGAGSAAGRLCGPARAGADPTPAAGAHRFPAGGPARRAGRQRAVGRRAGRLEVGALPPHCRLRDPAGHLLDRPANPLGSRADLADSRRAGRPGRLPGSDRRAGNHRPVVGRLSPHIANPNVGLHFGRARGPMVHSVCFGLYLGTGPHGRMALAMAIRTPGTAACCSCRCR